MIIKSKSRRAKSWAQLLAYMEQGGDERSITITHNLSGTSREAWAKEFEANEALRIQKRSDSVRLYHEIISFHDDDTNRITGPLLDDLLTEYIRLRAERGLVVAVTHHDQDHVHAHLCVSGIEYATGKSMRMSKSQFTAIKRSIQTLQQERYPELRKSIADHGRRAREVHTDQEHQLKARTKAPSKREDLSAKLRELFHRASSLSHFELTLNKQGMELYRRNGRPQGIRVEGIKYRLSSLGIQTEEVERVSRTPSRLETLERIREGREREHDEPSRERLLRVRKEASGEPQQQ